jgi:hypothetical protein
VDIHGSVEKSIPLYWEDYNAVLSFIETVPSFSILKRILDNYYGDSEVYLNEFESIRAEIITFKGQFKSNYSESVSNFIGEFLDLVEYAIKNRKIIKAAGD